MQRVDVLARAWPLHASAATRAIERQAGADLPAHTLMRRAGLATARLALALWPHAPRIWVAAGPGNNGGDGIEAAVQLRRAGKAVSVSLLGDAAGLPADAADALARARAAGVPIEPGLGTLAEDAAAPAIDALLGLGGARAPEGEMARAIERLNARHGGVLAVDLPSGLDGDTGQPHGALAVRATHTLSLLSLKPGLYTGAGRDHAGDIWLDTLGVDLSAHAADALLGGGATCRDSAARRHAQHKGSFGDVHVVGGARGMVGAALLAARAALAAGAGRVYLALLDEHALGHDGARPELMFRPGWWRSTPAELAAGTVLAGCGGGEAMRGALPALLSNATRLVLDADALNAIACDAALQPLLAARAARARASVLTPHPLEAARLLDCAVAEVQADRLGAAQALVQRYGCTVLLKGSGTVIASPEARPIVNPTGNAALATPGTGDVLAGWVAGLWAQAGSASAQQVAAAAAFRHGLAADRCARAPLRANDLIERMHVLD